MVKVTIVKFWTNKEKHKVNMNFNKTECADIYIYKQYAVYTHMCVCVIEREMIIINLFCFNPAKLWQKADWAVFSSTHPFPNLFAL